MKKFETTVFGQNFVYMEDKSLSIDKADSISAEQMEEVAEAYKGVNRIHKPVGLLFWIDCKNGKASNHNLI
jgi:hypothetical protein